MTPQEEQKKWREGMGAWGKPDMRPCSLEQPLMMVIPPEGVIISCQRHPEGHFVAPKQQVTL